MAIKKITQIMVQTMVVICQINVIFLISIK
jgi:hypothetical protein